MNNLDAGKTVPINGKIKRDTTTPSPPTATVSGKLSEIANEGYVVSNTERS
jgi:hypothetical protein